MGNSLYKAWYRFTAGIAPSFQALFTLTGWKIPYFYTFMVLVQLLAITKAYKFSPVSVSSVSIH